MTDHAIIAGSFSDFKLIKTRATAQLIIEIPIEQADEALERLGGVPQSGKEKPVAIARLGPGAARVPSQPSEKPASGGDGSRSDRPKGGRRAREAGILCGDARFRKFLEEKICLHPVTPDDARLAIYGFCCVESRIDLDADPDAGAQWDRLHGQYIAWRDAA